MKPQAIQQAECVTCGANDENYNLASREILPDTDEEDENGGIGYEAVCDCGEEAAAHIPQSDSDENLSHDGNLSWDNASWNQDESE